MSDEYILKAPLFKWRFGWGSPPYPLQPLWARFVTTEAEWPTLCGDGYHRNYMGKYCLTGDKKGVIHFNAGSVGQPVTETGFKENEQVFGWLDKSDGFFKMKVGIGALPLEPCSLAYMNFLTGKTYGVRRKSAWPHYGNNMRPIVIIPGHGAMFTGDYGDFLWAGVGPNGFFNGGRITVTGQEQTGVDIYGAPTWKYTNFYYHIGSRTLWIPRLEGTGINTVSKIESWEVNESNTLTRRYIEVPAFYSDVNPGTICFVMSPWLTDCRATARLIKYSDGGMGWEGTGYTGWTTGLFIPYFGYFYCINNTAAGGVRSMGYPELTWDWKIEPQDMHPSASYLYYREFYEQVLLIASEVFGSEDEGWTEARMVWVVNKRDGCLIGAWNPVGSPFNPFGHPSISFYNGSPYVFRWDEATKRHQAMNILTGTITNWRDVYLDNNPPGNLGYDDFYGWGKGSTSGSTYTPYLVFRNHCLLLGPTDDPYMIINESAFTDLSGGCQTGSYRGQARYVLTTLVDKDPVPNAQVTCRIVGETIGTNAHVHVDQTVTLSTGQDGSVIFHSGACIAGDEPFLLSFSALDVVAPDKTYLPESNAAPATVFKQYGQEPPPQAVFTPDPAEFLTSSPFQALISGTYWHIMAAVVPTVVPAGSVVEYRFVCVSNNNLSSTWRNPDNVAGKFFPNGQPQVPQQYWVQVGVKNLMYYWTVQYRIYPNGATSGVSAEKQITNTLP